MKTKYRPEIIDIAIGVFLFIAIWSFFSNRSECKENLSKLDRYEQSR